MTIRDNATDRQDERVNRVTDTNWIEAIYHLLEQEYTVYGDIEIALDQKRQAIVIEKLPEIEALDMQLESLSFKARELEKKRLEKITMCMGEPVSLTVLIREINNTEKSQQFKALQENLKTRINAIQELILRNQKLIEQSLDKLNKNIGFWTNLLSQEHPVYESHGVAPKPQEGVTTVMHNA